MLECYLEQQEAIRTTLCLLDKNDLLILSDKNSLIKETISILQPFEAVTREMSGETYVTSSKIIPISKALQRLTASRRTPDTTSTLRENLLSHMGRRFLHIEGNNLVASATILDPRFKKVPFTDRGAADNIARTLVNEASYQQLLEAETTPPDVSEPSDNPVWQFFDQQVADLTTSRVPGNTAFTELQRYLRVPVVSRKDAMVKREQPCLPYNYKVCTQAPLHFGYISPFRKAL